MGYAAKVICDSVSPLGVRLTTLEVTFPRFILAEVNTHRALSKSSASSRAIPVVKRIQSAIEDPFIPLVFGKNEKGMQSNTTLDDITNNMARVEWLAARDNAVASAQMLAGFEVHKQYANRLLEPFLFHTAVISGTEWGNFFALRRAKEAQPEFRIAADLIHGAMRNSAPMHLEVGEWHRPYMRNIDELELQEFFAEHLLLEDDITEKLNRISVARCARVSYLTQDGKRDHHADLELFERILGPGHMAPMEHVATPFQRSETITGAHHKASNFFGWTQYRKFIEHENDFSKRPDYKVPE